MIAAQTNDIESFVGASFVVWLCVCAQVGEQNSHDELNGLKSDRVAKGGRESTRLVAFLHFHSLLLVVIVLVFRTSNFQIELQTNPFVRLLGRSEPNRIGGGGGRGVTASWRCFGSDKMPH